MIHVHKSENRGHVRFGWLDARHSFSFGSWYDPRYMGVSALRVINEDRIRPQSGFGAHPHDNMEILTYVLSGAISHKDSMGNETALHAGEFQLMSAGSGVVHSEHNRDPAVETHMLQIWLYPDTNNTEPGYQELRAADGDGLQLVVSPDGRDGSLRIRQNARIHRVRLSAGASVELPLAGPQGYLHLIRGRADLAGTPLDGGDGAVVNGPERTLIAQTDLEALWFDLP